MLGTVLRHFGFVHLEPDAQIKGAGIWLGR
jgi:hypothetical protein